MGFLDRLLAVKERTLLVLTKDDIDHMDARAKRDYQQPHYAVALFAPHEAERLKEYGGMKVALQFKRASGLIEGLEKWDPKPLRIQLSTQFAQADRLDVMLTKQFLDCDTQVHDFSDRQATRGAGR